VFGVALFLLACDPTPGRAAAFAAGVVLATTLLVGFLVLTGSLAFFAGRREGGELGFHAILLLSSYPVDVFAGMAKVVLYSVVPAAFVTSVPARLVDSFDLVQAAQLAGVAGGFALAGWLSFRAGLRRYASGSVWIYP
jgi:ABC-2 type transport system permease protein